MIEEDILKKLQEHDELLRNIWRSVEKTRRYFLWTLVATLATFVLPLIVLLIAFPWIVSVYTTGLNF